MSNTTVAQIMYTLGEIASVVFAESGIPVGIQTTLLSRPYDGLRMMSEHDNYRKVRVDRLVALLDGVPPDFCVPTGGLTDEHTQRFWEGYIGDGDTT